MDLNSELITCNDVGTVYLDIPCSHKSIEKYVENLSYTRI